MKKILFIGLLALAACTTNQNPPNELTTENADETMQNTVKARPEIYAKVPLTTDLSVLSENQKQVLALLIDAANVMNEVFWLQSFPQSVNYDLSGLTEEEKEFYTINYGPWDRLDGNLPFIKNIGAKPDGAGFYPQDMTKEEFEQWDSQDKTNQYTVIQRNSDGSLAAIPYHKAYATQHQKAANLLNQAALLTQNSQLKNYLELRAKALLTDVYNPSDEAWLKMSDNVLDIIIGPIENYEDKLFGYKTAHEAYVLVKDVAWSQRLEKYVAYLPELQKNLPCEPQYKAEKPGTDAQLNAYDVVFYAGDCNAGSKTIAVNLPNDEVLQQTIGTRRSQLKNAMQAKFDKILVPIANELIVEEQRKHITFEAFFGNTMFHEVAHGLGIKNTINNKGSVREALKEKFSALEEGKADILGLYMVTYLHNKGVYTEGELMDNYVTFLAGIFRSVRFGAASAHGKANMLRFNFFEQEGAFTKNVETGQYAVNFEKMQMAMNKLSALILKLQGDGDYNAVEEIMNNMGNIGDELQNDLNALGKKGIPVDIVFEQGKSVLELP